MLLNSICSLLADKYRGVPVYIEDVPEGFQRPSFLVTLATEGTNLLNKNVYRDTPIYPDSLLWEAKRLRASLL